MWPIYESTKCATNEGSRSTGSRATVQPEPDSIKEKKGLPTFYWRIGTPYISMISDLYFTYFR